MATEEIVADPHDGDSAVGDDLSSYTQSLRSSVLAGVKENGRQYHSYQANANYWLPEDREEQDRLELQHQALYISMKDKLYAAPLEPKDIKEVLDLGTGTGQWAIDYADENPHANVLGTDLSAIQPSLVPPNCKFVVDDFNKEWLYKQQFQFVHARMLNTSFGDPVGFFRKAYDALEPGGWFEITDTTIPLESDDDTIPEDCAVQQWCGLLKHALAKIDRDWDWATRYGDMLKEAGFINVTQTKLKWPMNPWPKDPTYKLLGKITLVNLLAGLEGFSYRPLMTFLGMKKEEVDVLLAAARKDARNLNIHAYYPLYVAYGQRPKEE